MIELLLMIELILKNPDSLLGRTVLGKYCHGSNLMEAKWPKSCSQGWRGILAGRDLLKLKLGHIIGDGRATKIWDDPWISLEAPDLLMGPASKHNKDWTVDKLIERDTSEWNIEKIREVIPEREAEILRIQLSNTGCEDKVVWLGTEFGEYSTSSGYYAAIEEIEGRNTLTEAQKKQDWTGTVWNKKVAPKIQLFLWKMAHDILPVGDNLMKRKVMQEGNCSRCGERETELHTLFTCPFAAKVWEQAPFTNQLRVTGEENIHEMLKVALHSTCLPPVGLQGATLFAWTCWHLWTARNKKIFEDRVVTEQQCVSAAMTDAREWVMAQEEVRRDITMTKKKQACGEQNLKMMTSYSDGAWNKDTGTAGLGWVIKREDGSELCRRGTTKKHVRSPLVAEALALREAMMHSRRRGLIRMIFKTDSSVLDKAINNKRIPKEIYGIVKDIERTSKEFEYVKIGYTPRKDNVEADRIVKDELLNLSG